MLSLLVPLPLLAATVDTGLRSPGSRPRGTARAAGAPRTRRFVATIVAVTVAGGRHPTISRATLSGAGPSRPQILLCPFTCCSHCRGAIVCSRSRPDLPRVPPRAVHFPSPGSISVGAAARSGVGPLAFTSVRCRLSHRPNGTRGAGPGGRCSWWRRRHVGRHLQRRQVGRQRRRWRGPPDRCYANLEVERPTPASLQRSMDRSRPAHSLAVDSDDLPTQREARGFRLAASVRERHHRADVVDLDTETAGLVRLQLHPHISVQQRRTAISSPSHPFP